MAVILPNSMILHIPKTGGQFVRDVLIYNNIDFYETRRQPCFGSQRLFNREVTTHCLPHGLQAFEDRRDKALVFVRHPVEWYRSYWAYRVMHKPGNPGANPLYYWRASDIGIGDHGYAEVDEYTHSDDFGEWIENMMEIFPFGAYSKFCKYYIAFSSIVGRVENLTEDLAIFLWEHEKIKELNINIPRSNTTEEEYKSRAIYTSEQKKRLCEAEKWIIENYYEG